MTPEQIKELLNSIPTFVIALVGSAIWDAAHTFGKQVTIERFSTHIARVLIGSVIGWVVVFFGAGLLFPVMDWKMQYFFGFIFGMLGFRIARVLTETSFGLSFFTTMSDLAKRVDELKKEDLEQLQDRRKEQENSTEFKRRENDD